MYNVLPPPIAIALTVTRADPGAAGDVGWPALGGCWDNVTFYTLCLRREESIAESVVYNIRHSLGHCQWNISNIWPPHRSHRKYFPFKREQRGGKLFLSSDWDWEWDWESRIENRNSPSADSKISWVPYPLAPTPYPLAPTPYPLAPPHNSKQKSSGSNPITTLALLILDVRMTLGWLQDDFRMTSDWLQDNIRLTAGWSCPYHYLIPTTLYLTELDTVVL